jgi:DNA repair exonuclease SbcCD ATPase subunit
LGIASLNRLRLRRRDSSASFVAVRAASIRLREAHRNPDEAARDKMRQISKRQEELEKEVRLLEERLRRLKQKSGASSLQDAQSAMREAERQLDSGEADDAERAQERAEKSLEQSQKELEEEERRYRALRQYELLFRLKEELRAFRRKAQGHREWLQKIESMVRQAGRVTRHIRRGELDKLRSQVKTLQRDVAEKGEALQKENAIVYTYVLKSCATDLQEIEGQLAMKEVGLVPQELLGDVVRRFDLAIKGLEQNLRERQKSQQQQQSGKKPQGQPQPRLVGLDAEIRMLKVFQEELNKNRKIFFDNRPEFLDRAPSESEKRRIEQFYHTQGSLAELFDEVRQSLVGEEQDEPMFPGEGEDEKEKQR